MHPLLYTTCKRGSCIMYTPFLSCFFFFCFMLSCRLFFFFFHATRTTKNGSRRRRQPTALPSSIIPSRLGDSCRELGALCLRVYRRALIYHLRFFFLLLAWRILYTGRRVSLTFLARACGNSNSFFLLRVSLLILTLGPLPLRRSLYLV